MQSQEEIVYFEVGDLLGVGMTLVVLGIGLAYGISVVGDVGADFCDYGVGTNGLCLNSSGRAGGTLSVEFNATHDTKVALAKIPTKLGLIVTVVLAAVIIGILVRYLFIRFG